MASKKILVVDDEETTLTLMQHILSEEGYEVCIERTGNKAVKLVSEISPDLILMDIVLPDINGAEAVQLIHENPKTKHIKVIFFSGILEKDEADPELQRIKAGNNHYEVIPKPIDREELLGKIARALNSQ